MAHSLDRGGGGGGGVGRAGRAVKCVFFLVGFMFVCYLVRPQSLREGSNAALSDSCPPCDCDCSAESDFILSMPFDGFNETFADCGRHDPEMSEEMEKDIVALLSEEVTLQKNVTSDSLEHTEALIIGTKRVSWHYQNEAEKCNSGVESCEEARERAEAALREERKLTAIWEARAHEYGLNK